MWYASCDRTGILLDEATPLVALMGTLGLVVLGGAAAGLSLPLVSSVLARPRRRKAAGAPHQTGRRLLFVVPAHDEELLVGACARSLVAMDYPTDRRRIVVIADNCSDRTAEFARAAGAECLERHDAAQPGKPRALAWALAQLPLREWDAVVIVDADSTVDPGFAHALAREMHAGYPVVQAYFGTANEWASWLTVLGGVLARSRYEVVYPRKRAAGLNCPLTGNGMCIDTRLLADQGWQAFSLTENWELYARYTVDGVAIGAARDAMLYSDESRSLRGSATQRRRWLAGRIEVLRTWGRAILRSPRISWHQKLDALVELGAPSPVLHLLAAVAVAALALATRSTLGTVIAVVSLVSLAHELIPAAIVAAGHPRKAAVLRAALFVPVYAVWRLAVAIRTLLTLRDRHWRKTTRHGTEPVAVQQERA